MNRRTLLRLLPLGTLAACVAGQTPLAPAERAAVDRVQAWLDGLHELRARFQQTWPDGAVSEGTAFFAPPGRLRLDYAPNDRMVVVADAGRIVVTDNASGAVTRMPASASPLGLLLEGRIKLLDGPIRVRDVQTRPGLIQLTLIRADKPLEGQLTLAFDDVSDGLTLRSLQGVDAERRRTVFRLFSHG